MSKSKQNLDDFKKSAEFKEFERCRMQLYAMLRVKDIEHFEAILDGNIIPDIIHALVSQYPKTDEERKRFRSDLEIFFDEFVEEHSEFYKSAKLRIGALASSRQIRELEKRHVDGFNHDAMEFCVHITNLVFGLKEKRQVIKPQDLKI